MRKGVYKDNDLEGKIYTLKYFWDGAGRGGVGPFVEFIHRSLSLFLFLQSLFLELIASHVFVTVLRTN